MKTFEELKRGDIIYRLKGGAFVPYHVSDTAESDISERFRIFTTEGPIFSIIDSFVKKSYSFTLITENVEELRIIVMSYSFKERNKLLRKV